MEFYFSRQQINLLRILCTNFGFNGAEIRQRLDNYTNVSLMGESFEVVENAVSDIKRRIANVSDEEFGAYLEREIGRIV